MINTHNTSSIVFLLMSFVATTPLTSSALPSTGVEIGNGKVDEHGGFEIGHGSFASNVYQIVGKWHVTWLKKLSESSLGKDAIKTSAKIDFTKTLALLSVEDLFSSVDNNRWNRVRVATVDGVKENRVSSSNVRQLEYRLLVAPGQLVTVLVTGPTGSPADEAFENFQKTLESMELPSSGT